MPPMPPETKAMRETCGIDSSRQASGRCATSDSLPMLLTFLSLSLDCHRYAHPAADAERGEALLRVALLHLVQQRDEDARARGADRMAERDRAAVHVHLAGVPAHLPVHRDRLRGERLVDLQQIE